MRARNPSPAQTLSADLAPSCSRCAVQCLLCGPMFCFAACPVHCSEAACFKRVPQAACLHSNANVRLSIGRLTVCACACDGTNQASVQGDC